VTLAERVLDEVLTVARSLRAGTLGYGSKLCLVAEDRTILRVEDGSGNLVGGSRTVDDWSTFVIVHPSDANRDRPGGRIRMHGLVGLRSVATGRFVGVDFDNDRRLTCWAGRVGEWESFRIAPGKANQGKRRYVHYGMYVSLAVHATWRGDEWWQVQYHLHDDPRYSHADVQHVGTWETFTMVRPS
jgi:hypothetical protein